MYSLSITPEYEAANEQYAEDFDKGDLALPPSRYVNVNYERGHLLMIYR